MNEEDIALLKAYGYTVENGIILKDNAYVKSVDLGEGKIIKSQGTEAVYLAGKEEEKKLKDDGFLYQPNTGKSEFVQKQEFKAQKSFENFFEDPTKNILEKNMYTNNIFKKLKKEGYVKEDSIKELESNMYHDAVDNPVINEFNQINKEAGKEVYNIDEIKKVQKEYEKAREKTPNRNEFIERSVEDMQKDLEEAEPNYLGIENKTWKSIVDFADKVNKKAFDLMLDFQTLGAVAREESGRGQYHIDPKTKKVIPNSAFGKTDKEKKQEFEKIEEDYQWTVRPVLNRIHNKISKAKDEVYKRRDDMSFSDRWFTREGDSYRYAYNILDREQKSLEDALMGSKVYIPTDNDVIDFATVGFGDVIDQLHFDLSINKKLNKKEKLTPGEAAIVEAHNLVNKSKGTNYTMPLSYDIIKGTTESLKFLVGGLGGRALGKGAGEAISLAFGKKFVSKGIGKFTSKALSIGAEQAIMAVAQPYTYQLGINSYVGETKVIENPDGTHSYLTSQQNYDIVKTEIENNLDDLDDKIRDAKTAGDNELVQKLFAEKKKQKDYLLSIKPYSAGEALFYGFTESLKENITEDYATKILPGKKFIKKQIYKTPWGKALYKSNTLRKLNRLGLPGKNYINKKFGSTILGNNKIIGSNLEEVWEEVLNQVTPTYRQDYGAQLNALKTRDFYAKIIGQTLLMGQGMQVLGKGLNTYHEIKDKNKDTYKARKYIKKLYESLQDNGLSQKDFDEIFMKTGQGKYSVQQYNNKITELKKEHKDTEANELEQNKFFNQAMNALKYGQEKNFRKVIEIAKRNPNLQKGNTLANLLTVEAEMNKIQGNLGEMQSLENRDEVIQLHSNKRYTDRQIKNIKDEIFKYEEKEKLNEIETKRKNFLEKNLTELEIASESYEQTIEKLTSFETQRKLKLQEKIKEEARFYFSKVEKLSEENINKAEEIITPKFKNRLALKDIQQVFNKIRIEKKLGELKKRADEVKAMNAQIEKEKIKAEEEKANLGEGNTILEEGQIVNEESESKDDIPITKENQTLKTDVGDILDNALESTARIVKKNKKKTPKRKSNKTEENITIGEDLDDSNLTDPNIDNGDNIDFSEEGDISDEEYKWLLAEGEEYDENAINTLSKSIMNAVNHYKDNFGEDLTFDKLIEEILKDDRIGGNKSLIKNYFESFGMAWEKAGLGESNWKKLYVDTYSSLKSDIADVIDSAGVFENKVTKEEDDKFNENTQKEINSKDGVEPSGLDPVTDAPVNLTQNKGKISTLQSKANFAIIKFKEIIKKINGKTYYSKDKGAVPVMRKIFHYINPKRLANPNINNRGDILYPKVVPNEEWSKVLVAIRNPNGTINKKVGNKGFVTFDVWVEMNTPKGMSLEDFMKTDEFIDKVPMVYTDSEGYKTSYVTETSWNNPTTVEDKTLTDQDYIDIDHPTKHHLNKIKRRQEKDRKLRKQILSGKVTAMVITSSGGVYEKLEKTDENGDIIPLKRLEEVAPDSLLGKINELGTFSTIDGEVLRDEQIVNLEYAKKSQLKTRNGIEVSVYEKSNRTLNFRHVDTVEIDGKKVKRYMVTDVQRQNEEGKEQAMEEDLTTARWLYAANKILRFHEESKNTKDESNPNHPKHRYHMSLNEAKNIRNRVLDITGHDIYNYNELENLIGSKVAYLGAKSGKKYIGTKDLGHHFFTEPSSKFVQNTSWHYDKYGKGKGVVKISKNEGGLKVEKLADSYDKFLKKRLSTNIMGYNVGTTENPIFATIIQPTIQLSPIDLTEDTIEEKVEEQKKDPETISQVKKIKETESKESLTKEVQDKVDKTLEESLSYAKSIGLDVENFGTDDTNEEIRELILPELEDTENIEKSVNLVDGLTINEENEVVTHMTANFSKEGITEKEVRKIFKDYYTEHKKKQEAILKNLENLPKEAKKNNSRIELAINEWKRNIETIDIILSNEDRFIAKAVKKAKSVSFLRDDFKTEDEVVENERNYAKSSMEDLPIDKIGTALKRIFARIPNGEKGIVGTPRYDSFKTMYDTVMSILSSNLSINSSLSSMTKVMQTYYDTYTWMQPLVEELENASVQVQNQFQYNFFKQAVKAKYATLNYKNKAVFTQIYDSNANAAVRVIREKWKNNFKRSSITKGDKINPEVLKKLIQEWNSWGPDKTKVSDKRIKNWLKKFGINVSKETWKAIKRGELEFYSKEGGWKNIPYEKLFMGEPSINKQKGTNKSNTLFMNLLGYLVLNQDKEDLEYIENTKNHPFHEMNFILKGLAKLEAKYNPVYISSTRYVAGKMLSEVEAKTHFYETTNKLKNSALTDEEYITNLAKLSFSSNSMLLHMLHTDKEFAQKFEADVIDVMALKQLFTKDPLFSGVDELSSLDYMFMQRALHEDMRQGKVNTQYKDNGFEMRMGYVSTPTNSDKGRMMLLKTAIFDLYKNAEQAFNINDKNEISFTKNLKQLLYDQLIEPELKRALNHTETNIEGYDKGARRFNFIPSVNSIKSEDGKSVLTAISEGSAHTAETFKRAYYKPIMDHLEKMILAEVQRNIETTKDYKRDNIDTFHNSEYLNRRKGDFITKRLYAELDYTINSMIGNMNTFQTIAGDPAMFFKSKEDIYSDDIETQTKISIDVGINLGKRMALMIAPGLPLANSHNEQYIQIFMNDVIDFAENVEDIIGWIYGKKSLKEKIDPKSNPKIDFGDKTYMEHIEDLRKINLTELKNDSKLPAKERKYNKESIILEELEKRFPKLAGYFNIETTDAQEYSTLKEHIRVLKGQGRLSEEKLKTLNNIITKYEEQGEDLKLNDKELDLILQPIKPVYTGSVLDLNQDVNRMVYIKSSSFPLIPGLTGGTKLDALRKKMEEIERKEKKFVRASYLTANKVGSLNSEGRVNPFDKEDVSTIDNSNYLLLDRTNFKIQQDIPFKSSKVQEDVVSMGTQIFKLLMGDEVTSLKDFELDGEKMSGTALHEEMFKTFSQIIDSKKETLLKKLGLDANMETDNPEVTAKKFEELVRKEAEARGFSEQDLKMLGLEERLGKNNKKVYHFKLPLWFSANSNKIEAMFNAIITNNIFKQKLPGNSLVVGSEQGLQLSEDLENLDQNEIITIGDYNLGELQGTKEKDGKIKKAQILIPSKFKANGKLIDLFEGYTKKNGEGKYIKRNEDGILKMKEDMFDKELLEQFAYRIPTSSHALGSTVEVAGFLPPESGDLIITPKGFIAQMGQDFDVDKLNMYQFNHEVFPDGSIRILNEKNKEQYIKFQKQRIKKIRDELSEIDYVTFLDSKNKDIANLLGAILNKDIDEIVSTEISELRKELADTYKNINKDFDLKIAENKLIKIHNAVYSHPKMQKNITKVLSRDFAEKQAEGIDKALQKDNSYFNILSPEYQRQKMNLGSTGQIAIGIYAKGVTFHSLVQQSPADIGLLQKMRVGDKVLNVPKIIQIGKLTSDGVFGKLKTINKENANDFEKSLERKTSDVLDEKTQTAVDNEVAQVLGKVGLNNRDAIAVDNLLGTLGINAEVNEIKEEDYDKNNPFHKSIIYEGKVKYYEEYSIPYLLHSQAVIKKYFEKIQAYQSITTPFTRNSKNKALEELVKEKLGTGYKIENGKLYKISDTEGGKDWEIVPLDTQNFTAENLLANVKDSVNDLFDIKLLTLYTDLIAQSKKQRKLMSLIDMNNLGKSMWEADHKIKEFANLVRGGENYVQISNVNSLIGYFDESTKEEPNKNALPFTESDSFVPTTMQGKMIGTALSLSEHLFSDYFAAKNDYIANVVDNLVDMRGIDRSNDLLVVKAKEEIFQEIKKYATSATHNQIYKESASEVRDDLFIDKEDHKSLSTYIGDVINSAEESSESSSKKYNRGLKSIKKNKFLALLSFEKGEKGKPSLVTFNNAEVRDVSQEDIYNGFRELLLNDYELPARNGEAYSTRKLAQELIAYSFAGGGIVKGAVEFHKFIPYEYFDDLKTTNNKGETKSVTNLLQHWDTIVSDWSVKRGGKRRLDDFVKQYYQNNPRHASQYSTEFRNDNFVWEGKKGGNIFSSKTPLLTNFVSIKVRTRSKLKSQQWKLYQNVGNNTFVRVDVLGDTGMSEYEYGSEDLKSVVNTQTKPIAERPSDLGIDPFQKMVKEKTNFEFFETDTPSSILDRIINSGSEDKYLTSIAKALQVFEAKGTTFNLVNKPERLYAGAYAFSDDSSKSEITINESKTKGYTKDESMRTFLHEYIHALSSKYIKKYIKLSEFSINSSGFLNPVQLTDDAPKAIVDLVSVFNEYRRQIENKHKGVYKAYLLEYQKHINNIKNGLRKGQEGYQKPELGSFGNLHPTFYATLEIDEFMAMTLANNRNVIKSMKEMSYKKTNLNIFEKMAKVFVQLLNNIKKTINTEGTIAESAMLHSMSVIHAANDLDLNTVSKIEDDINTGQTFIEDTEPPLTEDEISKNMKVDKMNSNSDDLQNAINTLETDLRDYDNMVDPEQDKPGKDSRKLLWETTDDNVLQYTAETIDLAKIKFGESESVKGFADKNKLGEVQEKFANRRKRITYDFLYSEADKRNIKLNKEFVSEDEAVTPYSTNDEQITAFFNKEDKTINLTENFERLDPMERSTTLAHESLHGIITDQLNKMSRKQVRSLNKELSNFINSIRNNEELLNSPAVQELFKKVKKGGSQEIITYAFTDKALAAALNNVVIPGENIEKKTFWSKLKELILSIISDDRTKMDELSDIMDKYMEIPVDNNSGEKTKLDMEDINNLPNCI